MNQLFRGTKGVGRLLSLVLTGVGGLGLASGQVSLPEPPAEFRWESQGVMVYTVSDAFTVDLGQNAATGTPGQTLLDETLSLMTFDASVSPDQFMVVHSSTYTANLSGLGSAVVVNLDGTPATFNGSIGFNNWNIDGGGTASDQVSNAAFALGAGSGGLFADGGGATSLEIERQQSGAAPTSGAVVEFDFNGFYDVSIDGTASNGLWFGTGSARGDATVQTVYERFDLVAIPEPSALLLMMLGLVVGLRRSRA